MPFLRRTFFLVALSTLPGVAGAQSNPESLAPPRELRDRTGMVAALAPAAVTTPAAPRDTGTPPPAASPATTGSAVTVAVGKVTLSGLLQAWYLGGDQHTGSTFRVRRGEMRFSGDIAPRAKWTVMVDVAKALSLSTTQATVDGTKVLSSGSVNQSGRMLQDAFVSLQLPHGMKLDAGQFKLPLSLEGLQSSAKLEVVERALFLSDRARGGALGDVRDVGVSLRGALGSQLDWQGAIYNGMSESTNTVDGNEQKTAAARVTFRPRILPGLHLGVSGAHDPGTRGQLGGRQRVGGELLYARGRAALRGEVMTARDGAIRRRGWYAHGDYMVAQTVQVVLRHDDFDPDLAAESGAANVREQDVLAGVNVALAGPSVRFQVSALRKRFAGGLPARHVALLNLQTSW